MPIVEIMGVNRFAIETAERATSIMHPVRLFHTVRYLKLVQIYGRVARQILRPRPRTEAAPPIGHRPGIWVGPVQRPVSLLGPTHVKFLNETGEIATPAQWNDPARPKLWLYNLHYFNDLNAAPSPKRTNWQAALLDRWVAENPPGTGVGWEPYPLSLRIANWIKWVLAGNRVESGWLRSLAVQTRWLANCVEWHLLGNHLLANAKTLVLAGMFFEGPEARRWLDLGTEIYARELPRQILSDGGHFERSPMYHAIILEDLLDVLNAIRAYHIGNDFLQDQLPGLIQRMQAWLREMIHPDGEIAFFNDAAFGIAGSPAALYAYARRLGLGLHPIAPPEAALVHLKCSGYVRVDLGEARALLDLAAVGPDYLPGHAHADTLSFELSIGRERVIVNSGTSEYGAREQRLRERATAAHSTVEIDGENSSEVWGGFRVARRARVFNIRLCEDTSPVTISAAHDGYHRLAGRPTHRRLWRASEGRLLVVDSIDGRYREAVARFHLGPGVIIAAGESPLEGRLHTAAGRTLYWRSSAAARIEPSQWHPEFGLAVATDCLAIPMEVPHLETEFSW